MTGATRELLRDLIARASGVANVQWTKDATLAHSPAATAATGSFWAPTAPTAIGAGLRGQATIRLRVLASVEVGTPETRQEYDAGDDRLLFARNGSRATTVTMTCVSYTVNESFDLLETLRTRLSRPAVREELAAMGLAVSRIHPLFETREDTAVLDVKFNDMSFDDMSEGIGSDDPGDYIATATAVGTGPLES